MPQTTLAHDLVAQDPGAQDPDAQDPGAQDPGACPAQAAGDSAAMAEQASDAAAFLKAMGNERRLMILCHLSEGERSVTELEQLLDSRQAAVSQQLARLRAEGFVACRRDGKAIYYSISDERVARLVQVMHDLFCAR